MLGRLLGSWEKGQTSAPQKHGRTSHGNNIRTMQLATATVVDGKLTVEGLDIPDGEMIVVLARETEEEVVLSPEEEAELLESIAEADRGETITAEELFARLDRLR
jgi:hypothetical protein